jgi:hypothetical protein
MKTAEIEWAVAHFFNPYKKLIVPNISWGLGLHECDLLILSNSGYAWEIEIKVSKADLIADKKKMHGHYSDKIKDLYFAIPDYLKPYISHVPKRAGIILVYKNRRCKKIRNPISASHPYRFTKKERLKMAELGAMRIWGLKKKLLAGK